MKVFKFSVIGLLFVFLANISVAQSVTYSAAEGLFNSEQKKVLEKAEKYISKAESKISKAEAIENAKGLATRYWWLPIAISLIALSVAILSYFND